MATTALASFVKYNGDDTVFMTLDSTGAAYEASNATDFFNAYNADPADAKEYAKEDKLPPEVQTYVVDFAAAAAAKAAAASAASGASGTSGTGTAAAASGTSGGPPPANTKRDWKDLIQSLGMDNKTRHVAYNEKTNKYEVQTLADMPMPAYLQTKAMRDAGNKANYLPFTKEIGKCGLIEGSRLYKLREQLVKQLKDLAAQQDDPKNKCITVCKEDEELLAMMDQLKSLMGDHATSCQLEEFSDNEKLKLIAAKKGMLEKADFSFLHSECESDINCNPFQDDVIPKSLLDCCGLLQGEILFNSPKMAAIGKALAGKQRNGQSPAALGHASHLYDTGIIAPGTNPDQLWVNVCYLVSVPLAQLDKKRRDEIKAKQVAQKAARAADLAAAKTAKAAGTAVPAATVGHITEVTYLDTKWVPANVCEQEKFNTLQVLKKAVTDQKRTILKVNRQILQLQMQMLNVQGDDNWFSDDDSTYGYNPEYGVKEQVKHSVRRARYKLERVAAARQMRDNERKFHMEMDFGGKRSRGRNAALRRLMNSV